MAQIEDDDTQPQDYPLIPGLIAPGGLANLFGTSSYRSRIGGGSEITQMNKTPSPEKTPHHFPTEAEMREKFKGVTPVHTTFTDPNTGFIHDHWMVTDSDGGKMAYRADGPSMTTRDPKTGIVVEEEYDGSHGPNGLVHITRDPRTGVATEEFRRSKDGGITTIVRDPNTGIVTDEDRLGKDGKLESCINRDPVTGADTGFRGRNRDGVIVGPPIDPVPAEKPKLKINPGPGHP
jgi:hypothetical protein